LKKKLIIYLFIFLFLAVAVSAINISLISPANETTIHYENVSFAFNVNRTSNCSLFINESYSNQTIENVLNVNIFAPVSFGTNGTRIWNVSCNSSTDNIVTGNSEDYVIYIRRWISEDLLDMLTCPTQSTAAMMILWLVILISLFFIAFGFIEKNGMIGFFGGIMLMITMWYLSPCQNFFAFVLALFCLVLIIYFAIKGLGFENKTFK